MTRNHLATTAFALAAVTLSPAWSGNALAQTTFTLAGGVNIASLAVSGLEDDALAESVTRLGFGVGASIPMSEKLGIHLGAGYSQKGANSPGGVVTLKIDYVEFTALAGTPLPVGDRASVHLLAGPALAFRLSCAWSVSFLGENESEDCGGDDEPKSMDMGLVGGGRLEIEMSDRMGVSFGALYNLGLMNLDDSGSSGTIKNRGLALQAGVFLSGG